MRVADSGSRPANCGTNGRTVVSRLALLVFDQFRFLIGAKHRSASPRSPNDCWPPAALFRQKPAVTGLIHHSPHSAGHGGIADDLRHHANRTRVAHGLLLSSGDSRRTAGESAGSPINRGTHAGSGFRSRAELHMLPLAKIPAWIAALAL